MVHDVVHEGNVYVINASNDCSEEAKNSQLLFRKLQMTHKGDPSFKFYWADIDLMTPSSWKGDKNKIIQYIHGQEVSGDVFKENGEDSGIPLVDFAHKQPIRQIENDRAVLKLICPSSSSCGGTCNGTKGGHIVSRNYRMPIYRTFQYIVSNLPYRVSRYSQTH